MFKSEITKDQTSQKKPEDLLATADAETQSLYNEICAEEEQSYNPQRSHSNIKTELQTYSEANVAVDPNVPHTTQITPFEYIRMVLGKEMADSWQEIINSRAKFVKDISGDNPISAERKIKLANSEIKKCTVSYNFFTKCLTEKNLLNFDNHMQTNWQSDTGFGSFVEDLKNYEVLLLHSLFHAFVALPGEKYHKTAVTISEKLIVTANRFQIPLSHDHLNYYYSFILDYYKQNEKSVSCTIAPALANLLDPTQNKLCSILSIEKNFNPSVLGDLLELKSNCESAFTRTTEENKAITDIFLRPPNNLTRKNINKYVTMGQMYAYREYLCKQFLGFSYLFAKLRLCLAQGIVPSDKNSKNDNLRKTFFNFYAENLTRTIYFSQKLSFYIKFCSQGFVYSFFRNKKNREELLTSMKNLYTQLRDAAVFYQQNVTDKSYKFPPLTPITKNTKQFVPLKELQEQIDRALQETETALQKLKQNPDQRSSTQLIKQQQEQQKERERQNIEDQLIALEAKEKAQNKARLQRKQNQQKSPVAPPTTPVIAAINNNVDQKSVVKKVLSKKESDSFIKKIILEFEKTLNSTLIDEQDKLFAIFEDIEEKFNQWLEENAIKIVPATVAQFYHELGKITTAYAEILSNEKFNLANSLYYSKRANTYFEKAIDQLKALTETSVDGVKESETSLKSTIKKSLQASLEQLEYYTEMYQEELEFNQAEYNRSIEVRNNIYEKFVNSFKNPLVGRSEWWRKINSRQQESYHQQERKRILAKILNLQYALEYNADIKKDLTRLQYMVNNLSSNATSFQVLNTNEATSQQLSVNTKRRKRRWKGKQTTVNNQNAVDLPMSTDTKEPTNLSVEKNQLEPSEALLADTSKVSLVPEQNKDSTVNNTSSVTLTSANVLHDENKNATATIALCIQQTAITGENLQQVENKENPVTAIVTEKNDKEPVVESAAKKPISILKNPDKNIEPKKKKQVSFTDATATVDDNKPRMNSSKLPKKSTATSQPIFRILKRPQSQNEPSTKRQQQSQPTPSYASATNFFNSKKPPAKQVTLLTRPKQTAKEQVQPSINFNKITFEKLPSERLLDIFHHYRRQGINVVDKLDSCDMSVLMAACNNGYRSQVANILDLDANCSLKNQAGEQAMHYVVSRYTHTRVDQIYIPKDHKSCTELLLKKGANINAVDYSCTTPLHIAFGIYCDLLQEKFAKTSIDMQELLGVEIKDYENYLCFLMQQYANPYVRNHDNKTAFDILKSAGTRNLKLKSILTKIETNLKSMSYIQEETNTRGEVIWLLDFKDPQYMEKISLGLARDELQADQKDLAKSGRTIRSVLEIAKKLSKDLQNLEKEDLEIKTLRNFSKQIVAYLSPYISRHTYLKSLNCDPQTQDNYAVEEAEALDDLHQLFSRWLLVEIPSLKWLAEQAIYKTDGELPNVPNFLEKFRMRWEQNKTVLLDACTEDLEGFLINRGWIKKG